MERREMATLPRVSAGDHPPLSPSYRMSRQMWPLLYMCGWTGEGGMKYTCTQPRLMDLEINITTTRYQWIKLHKRNMTQ